MTEEEWLCSAKPLALVLFLRGRHRVNRTKIGRRKCRLFGCACWRAACQLFRDQDACTELISAAEQFADGQGSERLLEDLASKLPSTEGGGLLMYGVVAARTVVVKNVFTAAIATAQVVSQGEDFAAGRYFHGRHREEHEAQAALVRCVFGNPFRQVAFDPAWRTSDAVALARGIYDDRAFDRLPILADALQDAGCDNSDILTHCRGTATPHARGCWVVDLVLGKE